MRLTAGLDSGPVALQRSLEVGDDDFGQLSRRLEELGAELLIDALGQRAAGTLELVDQDDDLATYAEKIAPEERRLDPRAEPALDLARRVRALNPHVGTYLELADGERLGVVAAKVADPAADGHGLVVETADGALELLKVRPPGGKTMDAAAYLRGHDRPRL
jgi:methionyl-tRNA formyltransferase